MAMPGVAIIEIAKRAKAGKGKKSPEYAEDEEGESDDEYAEVKASAAADAMAALQDDDVEGFGMALNDFVEACVARKLANKKG
jgi:hypothetical protein